MPSLAEEDPARPEREISVSTPWSMRDLRNFKQFDKLFVRKFKLGSGGDGTVDAYEHKSSGQLIAVKRPRTISGQPRKCKTLTREIINFYTLGSHPHIVPMLGFSGSFQPHAPAIFLPLCELGDLVGYKHRLLRSQLKQGHATCRIPENTVWKLFHDMGLVLDHMHNLKSRGNGYMHSDFKPGNILVKYPAGWKMDDGIPLEPVFQLTDFSRMKPYPPAAAAAAAAAGPAPHQATMFVGTPEYAPPLPEQTVSRPSGDMWSLGATLQTLALGIAPTQSRESFIAARQKHGQPCPRLDDKAEWEKSLWRRRIPTTFRPLSASRSELEATHDFKASLRILQNLPEARHTPYSRSLDAWYTALWHPNEAQRLTAETLQRYLAPRVEQAELGIARETEEARVCFNKARRLRREVAMRAATGHLSRLELG